MKLVRTNKLPTPKYPCVVRLRCSNDELALIKSRAAKTGNSVSAYLRKKAIGGHVSQPIQDSKDISELRQHMGLLKTLVKENSELRPLLNQVENLICKMIEKLG